MRERATTEVVFRGGFVCCNDVTAPVNLPSFKPSGADSEQAAKHSCFVTDSRTLEGANSRYARDLGSLPTPSEGLRSRDSQQLNY